MSTSQGRTVYLNDNFVTEAAAKVSAFDREFRVTRYSSQSSSAPSEFMQQSLFRSYLAGERKKNAPDASTGGRDAVIL